MEASTPTADLLAAAEAAVAGDHHPFWEFRFNELVAQKQALERENEQLAKNAATALTDLERERARARDLEARLAEARAD